MRITIVLVVALTECFLSRISIGAPSRSSVRPGHLLPWEVIAEKHGEGSLFYRSENAYQSDRPTDMDSDEIGANSEFNIVCQPNRAITVKLPQGTNTQHSERIIADLAEYVDNFWLEIGKTTVCIEGDQIELSAGIQDEGFFRLSCDLKDRDDREHRFGAYVVVCSNWKKDILAFGRALKNEIEMNADPRLIRSCISLSHVEHMMEVASSASVMSRSALRVLADAVRSMQDFKADKYPDLVVGLNRIRLKRFEGAPTEEFAVIVPDGYTDSKPWPVLVHTDVTRAAVADSRG